MDAARFRYLNQLLYTCPSQKAAQFFQEDPESFAVYHRGFAQQVARWPESPVQRLVHYLRHRLVRGVRQWLVMCFQAVQRHYCHLFWSGPLTLSP